MSSTDIHPCLTCGVCCQNYRVEFSVYELRSMGGTVPDELAHEAGSNRARMNGTQYRPVRCAALAPLQQGRTTLMVTHRADQLANADQILLLEQGQLLASGTAAELNQPDSPLQRLLGHQSTPATVGPSTTEAGVADA